jgi:hypothetical protein
MTMSQMKKFTEEQEQKLIQNGWSKDSQCWKKKHDIGHHIITINREKYVYEYRFPNMPEEGNAKTYSSLEALLKSNHNIMEHNR